MKKFFELIEEKDEDKEPAFDIAYCEECGWRGTPSECIAGEEGNWESGYYAVDYCPKCKDGGCVDYDYTPERAKEYDEWYQRKKKKK